MTRFLLGVLVGALLWEIVRNYQDHLEHWGGVA